jgi:DNA polymerase-3 subunit alpha
MCIDNLKFGLIHNHTSYSDGLGTVLKNTEQASKHGHDALGIMDHGTCAGLVEHWQVCTEKQIKPILGCEIYLRLPEEWQSLGQSRNSRSGRFHMSLVSTSFEGYGRLIAINNAAHRNIEDTKGKKYPIATLEMLEEFAGEGLIALTGCVASVTFHDHLEVANEYVNFLLKSFGKSNVYAEIMPHILTRHDGQVFNGFDRPLELAKKFNLKTVYTTDAHAPEEKDLEILRLYTKAKSGYEFTASYIQSKDDAYSEAVSVIGQNEALKAFQGIDEIITRTEAVDFKRPYTLPVADEAVARMKEKILSAHTEDCPNVLGKLTHDGILITQELLDARLKQEWELLDKYHFWSYFGVLWDILQVGHEKGVVTVARGSASGSYILYLLEVTQLHPVVHSLMFERFLAELRLETGELPDVDVDIPSSDRHYIQEYAKERWGFEPVGTVHFYGHSSTVRMLNRMYEKNTGLEIPDVVVSDASDLGEENPDVMKKFFSYAPWMTTAYHSLLGSVEKFGAHACAVVPLDPNMPVPIEGWGRDLVVNYSESGSNKTLQMLGMVKIDILSSENLDFLGQLHRVTGVKAPKEIPDNDPCFIVFQNQDVTGLFQFDTRVGKNLIRLMVANGRKINSIRVLSDLTSLGRPGPLHEQYHVTYAEGTADLEKHPTIVRQVFEQTNGVLIYQEQVAELFARIAFAEYNKEAKEYGIVALKNLVPKNQKIAQTDKFKKGYEKLYKMFLDGGENIHRLDPIYLHELFESLKGFVRYGFNLSHSLSYANISAQEAWYKYYYPNAFWSTVMENVRNNKEDRGKLLRYITDATLKSGLKFKPPHINTAGLTYTLLPDGKTVQCPISMLKGLGPTGVDDIINNQPFTSLADINERTHLNKSIKLTMYQSGMLDGLEGNLYDLGVCDIDVFKVKGTEGDRTDLIVDIKREFDCVKLTMDSGREYKIVSEHSDETKRWAKANKIKPATEAKFLKVGTEILFFAQRDVIVSYKRTRYFEPLPQEVTRTTGMKNALGFAIPESPSLQYYFDFAESKIEKEVGYIVEIEQAETKTLKQLKITLQSGKRFWFCIEDNNNNGFIMKRSKIKSYDDVKHLAVGDLIGLTLVLERRDGQVTTNGQINDFKVIL